MPRSIPDAWFSASPVGDDSGIAKCPARCRITEPEMLVVFAIGLMGLGIMRRRAA